MLRLSARFEDKSWSFELPGDSATLGSSTANDLVLPIPGVSRQHLRIELGEGGLLLTDLGSRNGIRRDGERFDLLVLRPGEQVRIGRARLELEEVSTSDAALAIRTPSPARGVERSGSDSTGERATTSEVSPSVALELVRRIARLGLGPGDGSTAMLLDEARRLLEARWLLLLSTGTGSGEPALAAQAGELPEATELGALGARATRDGQRDTPALALDGTLYLVSRAEAGWQLAARRDDAAGEPRPWQLDFFDFLAERTRPATACAPRLAARAQGRADLRCPPQFISGTSPAMNRLLELVRATVRSDLDVVILGETGTGKELLARIVHDSGRTAGGPFVAINCAAIPAELLEAELFGVEARVATGVDPRPGLFLRADDGTLFLDEIGDMSEAMQAKLLRTLQEREVLPVGGHRPRPVHVRVISASNKNLQELVVAGRFRADLFYRLRGLQFHLPPLRERLEDLPALVAAFVEGARAAYDKPLRGVSRGALALLMRHDWPGNVRELRNEVERAVLLAEEHSVLEARHFATVQWQIEHREALTSAADEGSSAAREALRAAHAARPPALEEDRSLARRVDAVERAAILEALVAARNNKSRAARLLGITRNGLALKMKRLGIG